MASVLMLLGVSMEVGAPRRRRNAPLVNEVQGLYQIDCIHRKALATQDLSERFINRYCWEA